MAILKSNREGIERMLDILSTALDPFIARAFEGHLPEGKDWTAVLEAKDSSNGASGKIYSRTDPQAQLRILTENVAARVTGQHLLTTGQRNFAGELRDVRNAWAHKGTFTADDAYRAMDTAERLLRAVGAPAQADEVQRLRLDLRRVSAEREDQKVARTITVDATSEDLPAWRDVLPPNDEVARGNYKAAEFAADLYQVAHEDPDAGPEYLDPVEFFRRTYLTEGLASLLRGAAARLGGDANAAPVINLQTNFGGGKTHSMLALWHLAAGRRLTDYPQDVQELLAGSPLDTDAPPAVHRAALVGNHIGATGPSTKDDGTRVNTLWGELAWQLGGRAGYDLVAESDRARTNPADALHELLRAYSPSVILIDEWVAYARELVGRDDLAGGSFDTQFSFAQTLTEAASATPGVLLAISIPASEVNDGTTPGSGNTEEVGGENGREALRRLQNVVRRVADQWRPASSTESFEIVRRRLFEEPDGAATRKIAAVAGAFTDFYRKRHGEFPSGVAEHDYELRIRASYPVHPEVFARLYEDWATLERFQRTRGVLRLMSAVIYALWRNDDRSPLIMPGSVPLEDPGVNSEITQYLPDSWKSVIDADVSGPNSVPEAIDQQNKLLGQRSVTRRLARTVFFGAAPTIGSSNKGIEESRVFLGTAVPGDQPGNFRSALNQLADQATYFYSSGQRYWFDTQANTTRTAKDHAARLAPEDVWKEIVDRLQGWGRARGAFAAVQVAPASSADIPDLDEARLVVVPPRFTYSRKGSAGSSAVEYAAGATERRGTAQRQYRNMLVFLAADEARAAELDTAVRDYLGWTFVVDHQRDLNLTTQQREQAVDRQRREAETVESRLRQTYCWALVPTQSVADQPLSVEPASVQTSKENVVEAVAAKLGTEGLLADRYAARTVRMHLDDTLAPVWRDGHVAFGDLWRYFATYPYLPRLRDKSVLVEAVGTVNDSVLILRNDGFGIAEGYDEDSHVYHGLVLPGDNRSIPVTDTTLIVRPDIAQRQREEEVAAADREREARRNTGSEPSTAEAGTVTADRSSSAPVVTPAVPAAPTSRRAVRFWGTKSLDAERYAGDFSKVVAEVLQHLAATPGVRLSIELQIEAAAPGGFPEQTVRTVSENATTLKFDDLGFGEE